MIKIRWRKLDPEHVNRYSFHERAVHLIVAVTCVYLVLSGLSLHTPYFFWMSSVLGRPASMRLFHPVLGLFYFLFSVSLWWIWRRDLPFNPPDTAAGHDSARRLLATPSIPHFGVGEKRSGPSTGSARRN